MTDRTPNRDQVAHRDAETARLAVEDLFETRPTPNETFPDVEVTVRRRRSVQAGGPGSSDDSGSAVSAAGRAPRVFKIEKLQEGGDSEVSAPFDAASQRVRDEAPSSPFGLTKTGRLRRRRLNGKVTIIRPQINRPHAADDEAIGTSVERFDAIFGTDPSAQLRYVKLMAKIADLERLALATKKLEAAVAVRWIKKAIREYGIRASDLGLQG